MLKDADLFWEGVHRCQDSRLNLENDKFFSTTLALRFLNHRDFLIVLTMGCNIRHSSSALPPL